ncbi:MAG: NUDIX domain-containing protein [Patescibacteria group bacterium]
MSSEKFTLLHAAVYFMLIKDGKILLVRRFNTGWQDGKYSLIAGHLERNETVKQAMIREAKEEAGINLNPKDLHIVHTMHRKSKDDLEYIDFFLSCDTWQGKPRITEHDKCDDMQWFSLKNLPEDTLRHIRKAIESYSNKISFSELGFE